MQGHRAPTRYSLLTDFYFSTHMISDTHKRSVYWMWVVLGAVLACVQFLECARAAQEDSQAFLIEIGLKGKWICLNINRCSPHSPSTKKASECIAELQTRFNSLSKEQKTQSYTVDIKSNTSECGSGCYEALMVHLVQQVAGVEGLRVNELRVLVNCLAAKSPVIGALFFIDKPERLLVVQSLTVSNVSSACFHSVCSLVQVCSFDEKSKGGLVIYGVPHINLTKHPLAYPWTVSRIIIDRAKTVDLGASVHRLPSGGKAEDSKKPGLWVRDKVMIYSSYNCCMSGSTVDHIERGVVLETNTRSFGIEVPESTPETELPEAVYQAVCAIRRVEVGGDTQRYVVVPHEAYKEKDPKALKEFAEQVSGLIKRGLEKQTDLMLSRVVELRGAPENSPSMCVGVGRSREEVMIPWVVRVEQEVLGSAEACAEAAVQLAPHAANLCVLEAIAVLKSVEEALSDPSLPGAGIITDSHGMTLLPCGCFEEAVLNKAWHRRAQGCKGKSSGSTPYQWFPRITLSRQADGSVRMVMPRAVPVFAMPKAQSPVYEVREIGEGSIEIRVSKEPEGVCAGTARRQYIRQIYPEVIYGISRLNVDPMWSYQHFQRIVFTADGSVSSANWMWVCVHVLETLGEGMVDAKTVEIGGAQKGAEEESTAFQKVVGRHLLTEKARVWEARPVSPLRTDLLCVEEAVAEHLRLLSQVVRTENLTVVLASEEGAQVHMPAEGSVSANPAQSGASRSITAPSSSISAIMGHLAGCKWSINKLRVYGKYRARRGAAQASVDLNAVQESRMCKKVVFEREVVFERPEEISDYFEWRKGMNLGQESAVKEYPGLKITMNDLKKVWIEDKTFDPAGDWRPRIQAYLEELVVWYPTGVHVVFQVRVWEDSEYDITQTYDFCPASNRERWYQVRPGDWQIELEVRKCAEKTDRVESTAQHRIYLAHEFPAELKYSWVHVPGWAMTTGDLKEETMEILEDMFGTLYSVDSYWAEGESRESGDSISNPVSGNGAKDSCAICRGEFNFAPTAEDLSKELEPGAPGLDITVLRCGHVYHRGCFEDYLGGGSPDGKARCPACSVTLSPDVQAARVGGIDMRPAEKEFSDENLLEVVPDYSHVVDGGDITWIIMEEPEWEESEEAG